MTKTDIKIGDITYALVEGGEKYCVGCVADSKKDSYETILCKELVNTACRNEIPCCSYNIPFKKFGIYNVK